MNETMLAYPGTTAILVRRHGIYVWGDTWQKAKTQQDLLKYFYNLKFNFFLTSTCAGPSAMIIYFRWPLKCENVDLNRMRIPISHTKNKVPFGTEHMELKRFNHIQWTNSTGLAKRTLQQ